MSVTVAHQKSSFANVFSRSNRLAVMCSDQRRRSSSFGSGRRDSSPLCDHRHDLTDFSSESSNAFTYCLAQALAEGRLVFGIYNCADALQRNDGSVVACFFPDENQEESDRDLFMLLIHTSCQERGIPMFKTSRRRCFEKFFEHQSTLFEKHMDGYSSLYAPDLSCFMIKSRTRGEVDKIELEWIKHLKLVKKGKHMPFLQFVT